jgi:hypothetical protein
MEDASSSARLAARRLVRWLADGSLPPRALLLCLASGILNPADADPLAAPGLESRLLALPSSAAAAVPRDAAAQPRGLSSTLRSPSFWVEPIWLHMDTALSVPRESLLAAPASVVRSWGASSGYSLALGGPNRWGRADPPPGFVDLPESHLLGVDPEHPMRPQFTLGGTSESLRTLMRDVGLNASKCMAPLMRMHSTVADGGPRTNVSLSAKCSFH